MNRLRRLQKLGRSFYLALPKFLVTKEMLENGVIVEVLEYDKSCLYLKVMPAGKHTENNQANRENSQKSRSACGVRKAD